MDKLHDTGASVREVLAGIGEASQRLADVSENLVKAVSAIADTARIIADAQTQTQKTAQIPVIHPAPEEPMKLWFAAQLAAKGRAIGLEGYEAYRQAIAYAKAYLGEEAVQKALTSSEVPFLPAGVVNAVEAAFNDMVIGRRVFPTMRWPDKSGKYPVSGAATAYVLTEGTAPSESEPALGAISFDMCYVGATLTITYEAANNFALMEDVLRNVLLQALGEKEDALFLTGTGSGQPLGIYTALNAASDLEDGTDQGLAVLVKVWNELKEPYKADAVWFMNAATLSKLQSLETPAAGFYMGTLPDGFRSMLFGRPIYVSSALNDGVILVGSASRYLIMDKVRAQDGAREFYVDATREGKTLLSTRSIYMMLVDGVGGFPIYKVASGISLRTWRGITNFLAVSGGGGNGGG